jgi:hypothetical protein
MRGIHVQVTFEPGEMDDVDEYRRRQQNPPTRPEAIRQLIRRGLPKSNASTFSEARA